MEISVISAGAVFLVALLLMVLICTSGQRDKSVQEDHNGSKCTGNLSVFLSLCDQAGCTIK